MSAGRGALVLHRYCHRRYTDRHPDRWQHSGRCNVPRGAALQRDGVADRLAADTFITVVDITGFNRYTVVVPL